jgi:SAM-dependent methyltransferase
MPPERLDFSRRAYLVERMDEPCSRDELRACLRDISRVNRWLFGDRPLFIWLNSLNLAPSAAPVHILDAGCGSGETLRKIERWASARSIAVELTGIDLNPDAVAIAAEATPTASCIQWAASDVFSYRSEKPVDIVISSLFAHHLDDAGVIQFLHWMEDHAQLAWFINDLSRAPTPYHLFRALAWAARLHPFVQYDGPVSIRRAFVAEEWQAMCAAAGLREADVVIQGFKPARLCVARRKPQ